MAMASRIEFLLPKKLLVSSRYNIAAVPTQGSAYIVIESFSLSILCILVVSLTGAMMRAHFYWLFGLAFAEGYVIGQDSRTLAGSLRYGDLPQLGNLPTNHRERTTKLKRTLGARGLIQKRASKRLDARGAKKIFDGAARAGK